MFFSFLSAVFLTALILVSSLSINYINMALNLIYKFNDQLLAQTNYSMVYIDDLAKRLSNTLYVDDQITAFLNSDSDDVMVTIRALQRVQKHILPLNYVESIYLYNANRDLIISSKTGELVSSENFYDKDMVTYIKTNTRNTSAPLYHVVEKEQKKSLCSYVIFDTNSQNPDLLNAIVINVDASVLTKSIQEITKYQNENNRTAYAATQHAAHGVYDCSDNTGGQPQCQQAGVRKNIRQVPSYAIKPICPFQKPLKRASGFPARSGQDADCADARHDNTDSTRQRRKDKAQLEDTDKHRIGKGKYNQPCQQHVPKNHIV